MGDKKYPFSDPEKAREAGRKGGYAVARKKLTLERVEAELPPMADAANIIKRLEIISVWSASGMLSGTSTHALVRAAEIGLRAIEHEMSAKLVERLKKRLEELEAQPKHHRMGVMR